MVVDKAVGGDLAAAELALKILDRAEHYGDPGVELIPVENWMADHPGQPTARKTREIATKREAEPDKLWQPND